MDKRSAKTVAGMLPIRAAIAGWLILTRPWETPTERAYRVCGECGLSTTEVALLIGVMRESPKTRAELLEDFRVRFDHPDDLTWCEPCAEAVLDAAPNPPLRSDPTQPDCDQP